MDCNVAGQYENVKAGAQGACGEEEADEETEADEGEEAADEEELVAPEEAEVGSGGGAAAAIWKTG